MAREPKRHRYRVTDAGLRLALFLPHVWARTVRPGLATVMPDIAPNDSTLRRAMAFKDSSPTTPNHVGRALLAACQDAGTLLADDPESERQHAADDDLRGDDGQAGAHSVGISFRRP